MAESDDLAKNDGDGLAVMDMNSDTLTDMIQANLGGDDLRVSDLDRINLPSAGGTSWEIPTIDGTESQDAIEGVIVDWQDTRAYWSESFEENPGSEPDCRSPDAEVGIGDPGGECDSCPMAEFGSADSGGGQACKLNRLLFILQEGTILPMVLKLPPSSVGECRNYFMRLLNHRMDHASVVTKIGLKTTENDAGITYSKASFSVARKLDDDEIDAVADYKSQISNNLQTRTDDIDDMEGADKK